MDIQRLRLTDQERAQCIDDTNLESKGKSYSVIMSGWIFDALTANTAEAQLAKALWGVVKWIEKDLNLLAAASDMYSAADVSYRLEGMLTEAGIPDPEVISSP